MLICAPSPFPAINRSCEAPVLPVVESSCTGALIRCMAALANGNPNRDSAACCFIAGFEGYKAQVGQFPECLRSISGCSFARRKLGCNAQLIVDEFGEKLLEELDYLQEARNIQVSSWSKNPLMLRQHDPAACLACLGVQHRATHGNPAADSPPRPTAVHQQRPPTSAASSLPGQAPSHAAAACLCAILLQTSARAGWVPCGVTEL